jgi:hypothetical protein
MTPDSFPQYILGDQTPPLAQLATTHRLVRSVDAKDLDAVYEEQQAHHWGQDWQSTNALLARLGLGHTSMSVGDVIEDVDSGKFYAVAPFGFTALPFGTDA